MSRGSLQIGWLTILHRTFGMGGNECDPNSTVPGDSVQGHCNLLWKERKEGCDKEDVHRQWHGGREGGGSLPGLQGLVDLDSLVALH